MGSYYYLAAQLPSLIYGQTPPMTSSSFKELAGSLLSDDDAALMDLIDLDPQPLKEGAEGHSYADNAPASGSGFIDGWREWERALRLNLARHRAQKTGREGGAPVEPPLYPADAAAAAVKAAVATESPLEAEMVLDRARWAAVDVLQGTDYFDRNTAYAFLLKLILLERYAAFFDSGKGFSEYKTLYASILEGVQEGESPAGEPK